MNILDLVTQPTPESRRSASASLSPENQPGSGLSDAEDDELPQVSQAPSRKRKAEDLSRFAITAARSVRLRTEEEQSVKTFAQLPSPQQRIVLLVELKALRETAAKIVPANAVFTVPETLKRRMEQYSFTVLVSHQCFLYVTDESPVKLILAHLETNPAWGLTAQVKDTKSQMSVVKSCLRKLLTSRRNVIKTLLKSSLGYEKDGKKGQPWDITKLGEEILAVGNVVMNRPVKLSLPMLARFAFLRQTLKECLDNPDEDSDYWSTVDRNLKTIRDIKGTPARISELFALVLENDCNAYSEGAQPSVSADVPPLQSFPNVD